MTNDLSLPTGRVVKASAVRLRRIDPNTVPVVLMSSNANGRDSATYVRVGAIAPNAPRAFANG